MGTALAWILVSIAVLALSVMAILTLGAMVEQEMKDRKRLTPTTKHETMTDDSGNGSREKGKDR